MTDNHSDLHVVTGRIARPLRILLLGSEKVGKTTFASRAPNPVFLDAEEGSGFLDVPRLEFRGTGTRPGTFKAIRQGLLALYHAEHSYQTLVIDTADALEAVLHEDLCRRNGWAGGIETPGYGKGYTAAMEDWRRVLYAVDKLRSDRGMGIIITAHTTIRNFSNPAGEDYSRFEPAMHKKSADIIKGWSDCIMFASHEDIQLKNQKGKAVATGRRVLRTERDAAWDAGNRLGLPPVLPLDWQAFSDAGRLDGMLAHQTQTPDITTPTATTTMTLPQETASA